MTRLRVYRQNDVVRQLSKETEAKEAKLGDHLPTRRADGTSTVLTPTPHRPTPTPRAPTPKAGVARCGEGDRPKSRTKEKPSVGQRDQRRLSRGLKEFDRQREQGNRMEFEAREGRRTGGGEAERGPSVKNGEGT
eukprot:6192451-Pleurochrysis_carterae.AAC.5